MSDMTQADVQIHYDAGAAPAVASTEALNRALVDAMNDGVCVIQLLFNERGEAVDYRFVQANAAFQNLVQRKAGAIVDMVFPVTSLGAGIKAANDAKIVVGTWGGGMGDGVAATNGSGGPMADPIINKMVGDLGFDEGRAVRLPRRPLGHTHRRTCTLEAGRRRS